MLVDTSIVDYYIEFNNLDEYNENWIYKSVIPGVTTIEEPSNISIKDVQKERNNIVKILADFIPVNELLWKRIFGDEDTLNNNQQILIVVGLPEPYDALVRSNMEGESVIIFDVVRLLKYDNLDNVIQILLTHEIAHILIGQELELYKGDKDIFRELKQLMFDEGFAHYLSYTDVEKIDVNDTDMMKRRKNVFDVLMEAVRAGLTEDTLIQGNSGNYWEKYIAISGFFTVVQYMKEQGNISDLYNRGYEYFWEYWSELATSRINFV